MPLIDKIPRLGQGVGARRQIQRRSHRHHCPQFIRRVAAQFSRHFQHQISAHRKSHRKHFRHAVLLDQFGYHRQHVAAEPRMVQRVRHLLGPAAIPLVQPHDVEPGHPRFLRGPANVARIARALQSVQNHQRRTLNRVRSPVAFPAHLGPRLGFEPARHTPCEQRYRPPPKIRGDGHGVGISQQSMWFEFLHHFHRKESPPFAQCLRATPQTLIATPTRSP